MFVDIEDVGILLEDVCNDGPGTYQITLNPVFCELLADSGIEESVLFTGVFAYALSRFIGSENVLFNILNEQDFKFHLLVNCENQNVFSFMEYLSGLIENLSKYDCSFEEIESEYVSRIKGLE